MPFLHFKCTHFTLNQHLLHFCALHYKRNQRKGGDRHRPFLCPWKHRFDPFMWSCEERIQKLFDVCYSDQTHSSDPNGFFSNSQAQVTLEIFNCNIFNQGCFCGEDLSDAKRQEQEFDFFRCNMHVRDAAWFACVGKYVHLSWLFDMWNAKA